MFTHVQTTGTWPVPKDFQYILVSAGTTTKADSVSTLAEMASGPLALCGLMLVRSYSTPFRDTGISGIAEQGLVPLLGVFDTTSCVNRLVLFIQHFNFCLWVKYYLSIVQKRVQSCGVSFLAFEGLPEMFTDTRSLFLYLFWVT